MSAATVTYANDGLDIKGTYGYLDQTGKASPCLRWSKELNPRQAQIRVAALAKKLESHACLCLHPPPAHLQSPDHLYLHPPSSLQITFTYIPHQPIYNPQITFAYIPLKTHGC